MAKLAFENVKPGDGRAMRRAAETTYLTFKKWFNWTCPSDCAMPVLRGMTREERDSKIKEAIAFLRSVPGFERHAARLEEGQQRISAWEFTIDRDPWPNRFRDLNLELVGPKLRIGAGLREIFPSYPRRTGTIIYGGNANPGCQTSKISFTGPKTGRIPIMLVLKEPLLNEIIPVLKEPSRMLSMPVLKEPLNEIMPLDKSGSMPSSEPGANMSLEQAKLLLRKAAKRQETFLDGLERIFEDVMHGELPAGAGIKDNKPNDQEPKK